VNRERWQEVKQVLAGALERTPDQRSAYLDQTCSEPSLRREVESLIAAHEQGDSSFMERPVAGSNEVLKPGTKLGSYEILARIGAGGMGVVYKARDSKLGRLVALKFLPEGALADQSARTRLQREAQNASALNHPNIATIYEAGEESGQVYIAMELVEGRPLKEMVPRDGMALETVLRYGMQIAAALAHAHERDIVHRDLKTANVVITADGQAKVLDFGLAKRLSAEELTDVTRSLGPVTKAGTVVGTLPYMAPEVLRGEPADARTDLWAFGIVLYEMATGALPFNGQTHYELSSAILREPPTPLPQHVPAGLRAIVQRCLAKEMGQRYQRAAEVRAALEAVGSDTAMPIVAPAARPRRHWLAAGIGLVALLILLAGAVEFFRSKQSVPLTPSQQAWVQITNFVDSAVSPALSPDGRMLTFIRGPSTFFGPGQIYVKLLPDGESVQLTRDNLEKMSPEFSLDGSRIAYTTFLGIWDTWQVATLGGEPQRMLPNASGLTWVDSQHVLFSELKEGMHMALVTSNESRADLRDVYVPPRERGMAHRSAISPDHKWVLLVEMDNGGFLPCRLVPFDGKSAGKQVGPPNAGCTYVAWSPDGNWMYLSSDSGGRFHIWRQRFPDGEPQPVTSGATEEEGITIAPDGSSLITSVGLAESTVWVHDDKGERQISSEGFAQYPRFSPDGKKLYYLDSPHGSSGKFSSGELRVVDLKTGTSDRLLPGFLLTTYDISVDGRRIAFSAADEQGHSHLWLASLDSRSSPRQFLSSADEDSPVFGPKGYLYFRAAEGQLNFLYRMKEDGSERTKVSPDPILEMENDSVSPDGQWVLVTRAVSGDENVSFATAAVPVAGGAPVPVCRRVCRAGWIPGQRLFFVSVESWMAGNKTWLLPVSSDGNLPALPPAGIEAEKSNIKGAKFLDGEVIPGPAPGLYAFSRSGVHRNLYRIPLQ